MLTASAELQAALVADSVQSFAKLVFKNPTETVIVDYSYDAVPFRTIHIEYKEGMFTDYCVIVLNNSDRSIPNLKGYHVDPGFGAYVAGVPEYLTRARMWVKECHDYSAPGTLWKILHCEGMFAMMAEQLIRKGTPPYYDDEPYMVSTVYEIVANVLSLLPVPLTLAALAPANDDGFVDTTVIPFHINEQPLESAAQLIYTLLRMTRCFPRPKAGLQFELIMPAEDDEADYIYKDYEPYYFREYTEKSRTMIPNHWLIIGNYDQADPLTYATAIAGEALDQQEIDDYMDVTDVDYYPEVTAEADLNFIAGSYVAKSESELLVGTLVARCNPAHELYDKISVVGARGY